MKNFLMTCKDYFGLKPGQTLQQFGAEVKALDAKDRAEMIALFKVVGIEVKPE